MIIGRKSLNSNIFAALALVCACSEYARAQPAASTVTPGPDPAGSCRRGIRAGDDGCSAHGGGGNHRARRPARRRAVEARGARHRLRSAGSRQRAAGDRADRSADHLQQRVALHGRDLLRLRARQVARLPAPPRRVPPGRRSLHVDHRHLQQPADGLFLRDEPVGPDGRRAARRRLQQPAVGRHLERQGRCAARSAGRSRSRFRSGRSTSIRTPRRGASIFSAPCAARTRKASGRDGCAIRD